MKKKGSISYAKYGYIFSIPFVLAYLIFSLYPTLYTAIIGFTDLRGVGKTSWNFLKGSHFFDNYKTILTLPTFHTALKNTIKLWVCNFIPQMILALLLSAWFTNRRVKVPGEGAFKVLFYMPNIITAATVAILFGALFGFPMGPVNDVLVRFHIIEKPYFFLSCWWVCCRRLSKSLCVNCSKPLSICVLACSSTTTCPPIPSRTGQTPICLSLPSLRRSSTAISGLARLRLPA